MNYDKSYIIGRPTIEKELSWYRNDRLKVTKNNNELGTHGKGRK
jgi:hypothetical protein